MTEQIIIIGGGQAGGACAMTLRRKKFEGRIKLIADEPWAPYKRPPLSKTYFAGEVEVDSLYEVPPDKLTAADIELLTGTRVDAIDREAKSVALSNGESMDYDKLVIATGGRARPLPIDGADAPNVHLLRTIADVDAIRNQCAPGKNLVVIGGGFIGLEVAAVAIKMGMKVTVLEGLDRVLARVTAPDTSSYFDLEHRNAGVDLRTGAQVTALNGAPDVTSVQLADGSEIAADVVVVGIGLIANTELAAEAGLVIDNGIVVDEYTQTSDPDIYACGDCTNHPNPMFGRNLRLESVQNALDQARATATNIAGEATEYKALPWFWSDQYDLKLQMAGLSEGYDQAIVRGDPAERSFSVFYLKDGVLIAIDTISRPKDFMMAKRLIPMQIKPDPSALADESVELKTLL